MDSSINLSDSGTATDNAITVAETVEESLPPWANWAPPSRHSRLSTLVGLWMESALRLYSALDEKITWDAGVQIAPSPNGPAPVVVLYLTVPSPILGEIIGELVMIDPQRLSEELVRLNVSGALDRMRKARAEKLATIR